MPLWRHWAAPLLFLLLMAPAAMASERAAIPDSTRKQLDTFFSNFSETALAGFQENSLTDAQMLEFAKEHALMNLRKSLKTTKDGLKAILPAGMVDKITEKYFGKRVQAHPSQEYLLTLASGEAYVFSQVTSLSPAGDNVFLAEGVIYSAGSGDVVDPHGNADVWRKNKASVEKVGHFKAKVRSADGRYQLMEYSVAHQNR